ncbi:hypothetical protein [Burkholderia cenocepacia]|uniref:hypothetical protein n=1 Tax=Burkholderia cenocepacia TaxID=95486 RepID=UPI000760D4DA|nr:hypothetical protein [Burkholderia cenocepacia]KWU19189.1 hypothetical protein AS149_13155 [Burkholderia cenocepacia]
MKLTFKLATTSSFDGEPGRAYFASLLAAAMRALASDSIGFDEAFAACEYLDLVDGGSVQMDKAVYRQCVALVGEYLYTASKQDARQLADKSWAANTLVEVMAPVWNDMMISDDLVALQAA